MKEVLSALPNRGALPMTTSQSIQGHQSADGEPKYASIEGLTIRTFVDLTKAEHLALFGHFPALKVVSFPQPCRKLLQKFHKGPIADRNIEVRIAGIFILTMNAFKMLCDKQFNVVEEFLNNLLRGGLGPKSLPSEYWKHFDRKSHSHDLERLSQTDASFGVRTDPYHVLDLLQADQNTIPLMRAHPQFRSNQDFALRVGSIRVDFLRAMNFDPNPSFALAFAGKKYGDLISHPALFDGWAHLEMFNQEFGMALVRKNWQYIVSSLFNNEE